MKNFLLAVWTFIKKITPFCAICGAFLFLLSTQIAIDKDIQSLTLQMQEIELNQANEYNTILTVDLALAKADAVFAQELDQIKSDEAKENNVLLKTIYAVDKNAEARSQGIVDGVNRVVDGMNYALSKPSYEYLKNITVRIESREKIADADGHHHGWLGTGCVLAITKDYTYILTNRHVVAQFGDGTHDYYVKYEDNKYPFDVLKVSKNEAVDLALIRVKENIPDKVAVIGFGESKAQDPIYSVGENLGRFSIYAEGTVSGFDATSNDEMIAGLPAAPGDSGSPIINKDGKLVALLYAGSVIDQEGVHMMDTTHGICVPIKTILLFLLGKIE